MGQISTTVDTERTRRQRDAQLRPLIRQSFEQSWRTYGSSRVQLDMRESGLAHHYHKDLLTALTTKTFQRAAQCQQPLVGLDPSQ